jgi:hypothetical protein
MRSGLLVDVTGLGEGEVCGGGGGGGLDGAELTAEGDVDAFVITMLAPIATGIKASVLKSKRDR